MNLSRLPLILALALAGLVVIALLGSYFTVAQTQQALVLQLGEFKRLVSEPGLHFKIPFVQNVVYYDRLILSAEPPTEEVIAFDQKRLVVDGFARYRIADPLQFYQSVGTEQAARLRLDSIVSASLRRVLGNVTIASVLSDERARIMRQVTEETRAQAKAFGIEVLDVRLRRADLPEENSKAIYGRMQSERSREAQEFRAEGEEVSKRIRSTAERERTIIIAEAQRQSEILRGQGEAETVTTYAEAFGKDKDFFAFYRSLQAYRDALTGSNTTFVLSPDSDFFRFLEKGPGGGVGEAAPR
jgi:membrane protease subunit HflC